jgi:hypothetical protein
MAKGKPINIPAPRYRFCAIAEDQGRVVVTIDERLLEPLDLAAEGVLNPGHIGSPLMDGYVSSVSDAQEPVILQA